MDDENDGLFALDQLIGAYLHQDMDLDAATVPEAIGRYSRVNDDATKIALETAMDRFQQRFDNDLHGEFDRRYGRDFMPDELGMNVTEFFDMVRVLLAEPGSYRQFETRSDANSNVRPREG